MPDSSDIDMRGRLLGGRYRLGRLLGRGGMGAVYEAVQEDLRRSVAIKLMHAVVAKDPSLVDRFRVEAQAAAAIGHPNITQVFDFCAVPPEPPFLVMELLAGASFRDLIVRYGSMQPARVAFIGAQVLSALGAAHARGIVRDIKPANIFICSGSAVADLAKVLDFGVAKLQGSEGPQSTEGSVVGTIDYMAPEQARGEQVDGRADLFAVGAMLYHAIAGRKPFASTSMGGLISAILFESPPPLGQLRSDVPPELQRVLERALEKDASRRFSSADEMQQALMRFVPGSRPQTGPLPASTVRGPTPVADEPHTRVTSPPTSVSATGVGAMAPMTLPNPMRATYTQDGVSNDASPTFVSGGQPYAESTSVSPVAMSAGMAPAPPPPRPPTVPAWTGAGGPAPLLPVAPLAPASQPSHLAPVVLSVIGVLALVVLVPIAWIVLSVRSARVENLAVAGGKVEYFVNATSVASGDVDGDGVEDFVTLALELGQPRFHVCAFSGRTFEPIWVSPSLEDGVAGSVYFSGSFVIVHDAQKQMFYVFDARTGAARGQQLVINGMDTIASTTTPGVVCIYTNLDSVVQVNAAKLAAPARASSSTCVIRYIPFTAQHKVDAASLIRVDGTRAVAFMSVKGGGDAFSLVGFDAPSLDRRWTRSLDGEVDDTRAPVLAFGGVYVSMKHGDNRQVTAFDAASGMERFRLPFAVQELRHASPGRIYVAAGGILESQLVVYDARTGSKLGSPPRQLKAPQK